MSLLGAGKFRRVNRNRICQYRLRRWQKQSHIQEGSAFLIIMEPRDKIPTRFSMPLKRNSDPLITRLVLSVYIFITGLSFSSFALACSPQIHPSNLYHQVNADLKSAYLGEGSVIAVVRPRLNYEKALEKARHSESHDDLKTQYLELDVLKFIKGDSLASNEIEVPKMLPAGILAQKQEAQETPTFNFWDGLLISNPRSSWSRSRIPCVLENNRTLAPDQLYLAFGDDHGLYKFEPISDIGHPLVIEIDKFVNGIKPNMLVREDKDFFANIDGYAEFKFDVCPSPNDLRRQSGFSAGLDTPIEALSGKMKLDFKDSFHRDKTYDPEFVSIKSYYAHESQSGEYEHGICFPGARYLVLFEDIEWPRDEYSFLIEPHPNQRFLKIENDHVKIQDVKTQIDIFGPERLSVETVKAWIRQGVDDSNKG